MKKSFLLNLTLLVTVLLGYQWSARAQTTTFSYTGGMQTYLVPTGITSLLVDMQGGTGGTSYYNSPGGKGGRTQCELAVTPGTTLNIFVGGKGGNGPSGCTLVNGGYNGGASNFTHYYGASGAGASDIRIGGTALTNRKVVAGGGGGGGYDCSTGQDGGAGGGLTAGAGLECGSVSTCYSGYGGAQTLTANGPGCYGTTTYQGTLGNGAVYTTTCAYSSGGGGGYYGGGAGGYWGTAGGGSSYTDPTVCSNVTHTMGYNALTSFTTGNGVVILIGPTITASPTSLAFGSVANGGTSSSNVFSLSGVVLGAGGTVTITPPTCYEVSPDGSTWYTSSSPYAFTYSGTGFTGSVIYVRFKPTAIATFSGNIAITGGGTSGATNVSVTGSGAAACSGTPTGGTATINSGSTASGNSSTSFVLNSTGHTVAGSIGYQWQIGSSATGPFVDIPGATTVPFTYTGLGANSWFRNTVTCPSSSTVTSSTVSATFSLPGSSCTPTCSNTSTSYYAGTTTAPVMITGAGTTSISDNSVYNGAPLGSGKYWNNISQSVTFNMGAVYSATMSTTSCWVTGNIWIDFDDNGVFDNTTELVGGFAEGFSGFPNCIGSRPTFNFSMPSTATFGTHRMRVICGYGGGNGPGASTSYPVYPQYPPCPTTSVVYADTRDYTAVVNPPTPTVTATPATIAFGNVTSGTPSVPVAFTRLNGVNLVPSSAGLITVSSGSTNFEVSTNGSSWGASVTVPHIGGALSSNVYVKFNAPTSTGSYSSTLSVTGGGLGSTVTVPVSGISSAACSGTPSAGTASTSTATAATTSAITLSISGSSGVGGLKYQWQSSASSSGPFTDMTGAISTVHTFTGNTGTTYYRCAVTCPTGGTANSNVVSVGPASTTVAAHSCGSIPNSLYGYCCGFWVAESGYPFKVYGEGGSLINDNATYTSPSYIDLTASQTVSVVPGGVYTTDISGSPSGGNLNAVQMWIDFNGDGTFSTTETVGGLIYTGSTTVQHPSITVPTTGVNPGTYRLRVMVSYTGGSPGGSPPTYPSYPNLPPCATGGVGYFQMRDYKVSVGGQPCAGAPDAGIVSAGPTFACGPFAPSIFTVGSTIGLAGLTYQWQSSTTGTAGSFTDISGATGQGYNSPTISTLGSTFYKRITTCGSNSNSNNAVGVTLSATPNISNFTSPTATNSCSASGSVVTVNSTSLGTSTFTVTYNLSGANTSTGNTATLTMGATNGTFTVPGALLATNGATTVTITNLTFGGCSSSPTSSNTATFTVGTNPNITNFTSPSATTVCAYNGSTATINSTTLGTGTFTVTYALSGANSATGNIATLTMGATSGTFTIPGTLLTAAGSTTLTINNIANASGCNVNTASSNTATFTVSAASAIFSLTGGGSFCTGGTGVNIGVSGTTSGNNYQLYRGATMVGSAIAGTGGAISFGLVTTSGTYSVLATSTTSPFCAIPMTGTTTVATTSVPNVYAVGGGGSYCAGVVSSAPSVTLGASDAGVAYQLYNGATAIGGLVTGTGAPLSFGTQTMSGTYIVIANPGAGPGCQTSQSGSATVTINSLPTAYSVTGGGNYCTGGSGSPVGVSFGSTGVIYTLYNGAAPITAAGGTNTAFSFGSFTATGTYSVSATITSTGCTNSMAGSVTIGTNPVPAAQAVTGGGSFCSGGTGVAVGLGNTGVGVSYQLYNGASAVGSSVTGTAAAISFGNQTANGVYSVLATQGSCTAAMTGTATVVQNATPTVYTVGGGGNYCSGGSGVSVTINGSTAGVNYTLYNGATTVATTAGTGSALTFGTYSVAGTYSVLATNATTSCTATMSGTAVIAINALPTVYTVSGGGAYCVGGTGYSVTLNSSQTGVQYQLYRSGLPVGGPIAGTSGGLDFGTQTVAGLYTVLATNVTTGCISSMSGSATITVNPLPTVFPVTGGGNYCAGATGVVVGLGGSTSGVNYQLYNGATLVVTTPASIAGTGSPISFGVQTMSGTFTVFASVTATGCTNNMSGTASVGINPLPTAYAVTGTGNYCAGGAGVAVGLGSSTGGVTYNLYNGAALVGAAAGTGTTLTFGTYSTAATYTVQAVNSSTGCMANMTGNATVGINALPTIYNVTAPATNYCAGTGGIPVGLTGSTAGVNYQLYLGSSPSGSALSGTGGAATFGNMTLAGTYTVSATNATTGCTRSMAGSASISIDPLPTVYGITGGGNYCSGGTGMALNLTGSESGINYQLYNGAAAIGSSVTGTGAAISLGSHTAAGTYTVLATNPSSSCFKTMSGAATVNINALPTAYALTTSGTNYCAGTTGITIGLANSAVGVNYQLYIGVTPTGSAVPGTGSPIDMGTYTTAGTYKIIGTDATTGCVKTMTGTTGISINPAPAVYTVTGGGSYCAGSTGVNIGLSGSVSGVNYQLYNGSLAVGSVIAGTGTNIDFGTYTTAGTYYATASYSGTSCSSNMSGNASVIVNPLPTVFNVTGGGNYCLGGAGQHVGLSGSQPGMSYQLYIGSTPVGGLTSGTGLALDFGIKTAAGSYTVVAYNSATTCFVAMLGSAAITVNSLPVVHSVTGGGSYCNGSATGVNIGLSSSTPATTYQLYNGTAAAGSPVFGTGDPIDFGAFTGIGTYTVLATNIGSSCQNAMSGTASVSVSPLPSVQTVSGGSTICAGSTGANIYLSNSATGINYQLYNGSAPSGAPFAGTGTAISFGPQTAAGTYSVQAINATTTCARNMLGSATINVNAQPSLHIVTGGGNYCSGDAGSPISLSTSSTGITYQLYNGTTAVGSSMPGTGGSISFGSYTATGTYSVLAMNPTTSCTRTMTGSATIGINTPPVAYNVAGGGNMCAGSVGLTVALSGSSTGVSYQMYRGSTPVNASVPGTGGPLSFGTVSTEADYHVIATSTITSCTSYMNGIAIVSVNPVPTMYSVTGGGSVCAGGTGADISLMGSNTGVSYQLYRGGVLSGTPVAGNGGEISFGNITTAGTYSVHATRTATGCSSPMSGSVAVVVNALPTVYNVTGGGSTCVGGSGLNITLSNSTPGIQYQLMNGTTASGPAMSGTGAAIVFAPVTNSGTYTVLASNLSTSCSNAMSGSAIVVVNALPAVQTVTGGGNFCSGSAGVPVGINNSVTGINYQLMKGGVDVGSPVAGAGGALSFGNQTAAGTYTVKAINSATSCMVDMTGSATVTVNSLPTAFTVLSLGSNYCAGGEGVHVQLSASESGIMYQLMNGTTAVGSLVAGTGSILDFGAQTTAGNYTIVASNPLTSCTKNMTGSATIVINPLPTAYTVTGGGGYCGGTPGATVSLSGSSTGITYQLTSTTSGAIGSPVSGTGGPISFGPQAAGTYMVIATNAVTTCNRTMTGSVNSVLNPAPSVYNVTGGGSYCAGGAGVAIGITGSSTGATYQLYNSGVAAGTSVAGTGGIMSFGAQAAPGDYTVIATNTASGCSIPMIGNKTITVNALPVAHNVTGGGNFCAGSGGVSIGLDGSNSSVNYQLQRGGSSVSGALMAGGSGAIDFGMQTVSGTYGILATSTSNGCSVLMTGTQVVTSNPLPAAYAVTGGGNYCATPGATGVAVGLNNSATGVNYQLMRGTTAVGTPVAGTGSPISFGMQTVSGDYTVVALNGTTTCSNNMSGMASVVVNPTVTPGVSLSTGAGTTVCVGVLINFTATSVNGGSAPGYQWKVNGSNVGLGFSTFAYVPNDGDVVSLTMTSSEACTSPATASASVTMNVSSHQTPVVNVTAIPGNKVCAGTTVTYTAAPVYGGTAPTFTWKKGGVTVGSGTTYSYIPMDGDVISCVMTSNFPCRLEDEATTNVTMTVKQQTAPVVSLVVNPTIAAVGQNVIVTATATNTDGTPSYRWLVNGDVVSGAVTNVYSSKNFADGDEVTCEVTNNGVCIPMMGSKTVTINMESTAVTTVTNAAIDIRLLPNPNKGDFIIRGTTGLAGTQEINAEVTDMLGQVVYRTKVTSRNGNVEERMQISNTLANGMYMLTLHSETATKTFNFVLQQ